MIELEKIAGFYQHEALIWCEYDVAAPDRR
jgi:hypothetical protein